MYTSGTTVGLLFDGQGTTAFDVTVWQISVDEGGTLFKKGEHSEGVPDDVSTQVNYIVRVEQPQATPRPYVTSWA